VENGVLIFLKEGKIIKAPVIAVILAVIFTLSAWFSMNAYARYVINREKTESISRRVRVLKQREEKIINSNAIITRLNRFIKKANALGLERDSWDIYDVNIREYLHPREMEEILNQCANSSPFYFKPLSFHVKSVSGKPGKNIPEIKAPVQAAGGSSGKKGDMLVNVTGSFLVKR